MHVNNTTVMAGDYRRPPALPYEEHRLHPDRRATGYPVRVALLGGFTLSSGGTPVSLALGVQRLLGLLALHDRPLVRLFVAGTLWADSSEDHAQASLRTALWRTQQSGCDIVRSTRTHLQLAGHVDVDVRRMVSQAGRLSDPGIECQPAELDPRLFTEDLLPDWYDEWVLVERERLTQLRLQALESLGERLLADRKPVEAAGAALAAMRGDPFRESARRLLIRTYLAQGNRAEAIRRYAQYEQYLLAELGVAPSAEMAALIDQARA